MQTTPLDDPPDDDGPPGTMRAPVLWAIMGLCCGIEMVLIAADFRLIGSPLWRGLAYQNGAFWAGLLHNWRPNYPAQPGLMFLTYAFLHAGFWHLAGNMVTLFFLGDIVLRRVGPRGFAWIYAVSALGGGIVFGLLTRSPSPMVGASGALFGLAGAWQYWQWRDLGDGGRPRWPVLWAVLGLIALNLLLWLFNDGMLAWETHLGGFVAGWAGAAGLRRWGGRRAGENSP